MLFKIGFCEIKIHLGISGFWDNITSLPPSTAFCNVPRKENQNPKPYVLKGGAGIWYFHHLFFFKDLIFE